jgi:hypothetical protein
MKKLLLLPLIAFSFVATAQTTAIPDANFEQKLIDFGYDNVIDGEVLTANISGVTYLDVADCNISDLTGIEDFTALEELWCGANAGSSNTLTSLDVSNNTALTVLYCDYNQLTTLDVSQNTALEELWCYNNQLTSIDVTGATALTELRCINNQLTSLDVSQNTALTELRCYNNQLTSLDVSQNTALTELRCYNNQLTSLDVSQNTALTYLSCYDNNLFCLNVANGNNTNMIIFNANSNPNLSCTDVDDVAYSTAIWTNIDPQTSFSIWCDSCFDYNCGTYPSQDICLVSVDPITNKNKIVWERPNNFDLDSLLIDSFYVYRDIAGTYTKIGGVAYDDSTEFVDNSVGVDPGTTSYRYKISVMDSCSIENNLGDFHKTIHLQVSQGTGSEHNLSWSDYEGFAVSKYRILRDDNATGNWNVIDSIGFGITSYTDNTPPSVSSRYVVEVVHPNGCTVTLKSGTSNSTWSNVGETGEGGTTGLSDTSINNLSISPNPTTSSITLNNLLIGDEVSVYNTLGQRVFNNKVSAVTLSIDLSELGNNGIYFVRVNDISERVLLSR